MKCPKCEGKSGVLYTNPAFNRRRRVCLSCGFRFTTEEAYKMVRVGRPKKDEPVQ